MLIAVPALGGAVAGAVGLVIPGVPTALLVGAGVLAGAVLGAAVIVLDEQQGSTEPEPASTESTGGTEAERMELRLEDAVTGEPIRGQAAVALHQPVVGERHELTVADGRETLSLRPLRWEATVRYRGLETEAESAPEDGALSYTVPPKQVAVAVTDRHGDPLTGASVTATPDPVEATGQTAVSDEGATHTIEIPAVTERVTLVVDHEAYDSERVETRIGDAVSKRTSVSLERPARGSQEDLEDGESGESTETEALNAREAATVHGGGSGGSEIDPAGPEPETDATDGESAGRAAERAASAREASASADQQQIEPVGVTGIDRRAPSVSPDPPRFDLDRSTVAALDDAAVLTETTYTQTVHAQAGDRDVALTLPGESREGDSVVDGVVERADEWRDIDGHPNVAKLLDADPGDDGTPPFVAVEHAERRLSDLDVPMAEPHALWTVTRLADALAAAHRAGVYHLNLTPENVLLQSVDAEWALPKLTGWDLPRLLDPPSDVPPAFPGEYTAPEQRRYEGVDERTDVYQLGVLATVLLTGEFPSDDPAETFDGASRSDAEGSIPESVAPVLRRATAESMADRYETMDALHDELNEALSGLRMF